MEWTAASDARPVAVQIGVALYDGLASKEPTHKDGTAAVTRTTLLWTPPAGELSGRGSLALPLAAMASCEFVRMTIFNSAKIVCHLRGVCLASSSSSSFSNM
jgi:hypothetical protein